MKHILLFLIIITIKLSAGWEMENVVTFNKTSSIVDETVTEKIITLDIKKSDLIISKTDFYGIFGKAIELSHIRPYNIISRETDMICDTSYSVGPNYIYVFKDLKVNSLKFSLSSTDTFNIIGYLKDKEGNFYIKMDKNGNRLLVNHFNKINYIEWKNNQTGLILGDSLYITYNEGYEWECVIPNINDIFHHYEIFNCKFDENKIFIAGNGIYERNLKVIEYDILNHEYIENNFESEIKYNNFYVKNDDELTFLGGKERNALIKGYHYIVSDYKVSENSMNVLYDKELDKSTDFLFDKVVNNDTIRIYDRYSLKYIQSTDGGKNWKQEDELNQLIEKSQLMDDFNFKNAVIKFDTIFIIGNYTIYRLFERNGTSVVEDIQNVINIYPNPAQDYIEVNINNPTEGSLIEIYNVLGEKVLAAPYPLNPAHFPHKQPVADLSEMEYRFNISYLSEGVYYLKFGCQVEKFVKM